MRENEKEEERKVGGGERVQHVYIFNCVVVSNERQTE